MEGHDADAAHVPRSKSTAVRLLRRAIASGWLEVDAIARLLAISNRDVSEYLSESRPIPLDHQLALASFVIESIPPLARAGHQLRGQANAAIAFRRGATETHLQPPGPTRF